MDLYEYANGNIHFPTSQFAWVQSVEKMVARYKLYQKDQHLPQFKSTLVDEVGEAIALHP